jgi:hypothetical protein
MPTPTAFWRAGALAVILAFAAASGPARADGPVKPPIRGLISMGAYKFVGAGGDPVNTLDQLNAKPGIFGGIVIVATWNQLQPTPTSTIADGNPIDQALAEVRDYNSKNPGKPLGVKLRIWGGFEAPDWAMQLGGPPIATVHKGKPRTIGRFWTPEYRAAWARLQQMLAARYDDLPLIREVAMTSCMSYTAEPFFLPNSEPSVMNPLVAAGYTDAANRQCLQQALADYAPWKRSRIVLAVNPFYGTDGQGMGDAQFTIGIMRACRQSLGARCVLDNHDLDATPPKSVLPLYAEMTGLGPEIEFQTLRENPADFEGTIQKGVAIGASAIELWQDYNGFPEVPDATLEHWAAMLEGNAAQ